MFSYIFSMPVLNLNSCTISLDPQGASCVWMAHPHMKISPWESVPTWSICLSTCLEQEEPPPKRRVNCSLLGLLGEHTQGRTTQKSWNLESRLGSSSLLGSCRWESSKCYFPSLCESGWAAHNGWATQECPSTRTQVQNPLFELKWSPLLSRECAKAPWCQT